MSALAIPAVAARGVMLAARNNGFAAADARAATLASVRAYREAMASIAQMGTMDIWYAYLDEDEPMASIQQGLLRATGAGRWAVRAEDRREVTGGRD